MNPLHLLYKKETGNTPFYEDLIVVLYRRKGQWILDEENSDIPVVLHGNQFQLERQQYDSDYIEWLEQKLMEYEK
jgi:hypothetical protein